VNDLLNLLNARYPLRFDSIEFARDSVSTAYVAFADGQKYFLRHVKAPFIDGAKRGADVQLFLQGQGFPVPPVILTQDGAPCAEDGDCLCILYEFIDGREADPKKDAKLSARWWGSFIKR